MTTPTREPYFLETERLGFRCWRSEDVELATELWADPDVARFIQANGVASHAAAEERLGREIACQREHGFQYWPMFLREGGAHVGCCGLRPYRLEDRVLEFGVHLRPAHWRKGLAVEAANAVIEYAFARLDVRGVFAGHNPNNEASRQMLERLGFRYTHDEYYPPTGLHHPSYLLTR